MRTAIEIIIDNAGHGFTLQKGDPKMNFDDTGVVDVAINVFTEPDEDAIRQLIVIFSQAGVQDNTALRSAIQTAYSALP